MNNCEILASASISEQNAEALAKKVIEATGGSSNDYWTYNELNCLKAILLYISNEGNTTLGEAAELLKTATLESLRKISDVLPDEHPARKSFNILDACTPEVKMQIVNGLNVRLSRLGLAL